MPPKKKKPADMDAAKIKSEVAQQQLEVEVNTLETLLTADPVDQDAVEAQLIDVDTEYNRFLPLQGAFIDHLLGNNMAADHAAQEAISLNLRKKISRLRIQVCKLGAAAGAPPQPPQLPAYQINLPKRNLPKFDGDVRQFKAFWAAFEEIDKNPTIPEIEKYNYLREHMVPGSRAEKAVVNFQPDRNSYQLAKQELQERFGRETTLIKVCVRDLLELMDSSKKNKKDFVDVATALQSQIMYLGQLGVTKDKYGLLLYPIIESSIPKEVLDKYLETPGCKEDLDDILEFLRREVRRREESALAQEAFNGKDEDRQRNNSKKGQASSLPTATNFLSMDNKPSCGFCGNSHPTAECMKAITMSDDDKRAALKKSNTCFKCLGRNHTAKACRTKVRCVTCKRKHHVLMCNPGSTPQMGPSNNSNQQGYYYGPQYPANGMAMAQHPPTVPAGQPSMQFQVPFVTPQQQQPNVPPQQTAPVSHHVPQQPAVQQPHLTGRQAQMNFIQKPEVLLETMLVRIYHPSGTWKNVRVMIDSGAQSSYVRRELADEMQLEILGKEKVIHQTFGAKLSGEVEHYVARVAISGLHHPHLQIYTFAASVVEDIAKNVIAVPDGSWFQECANLGIPLTDVNNCNDIDIMIGNDIAPYMKVGMRSVQLPSSICATETRVGWYLGGKLPGMASRDPTKAMMCISMQITDREVESYWALETIGIRDANENRTRAELEQAALDHFKATVKRDERGRYEVNLPYIEGHPAIPDNRAIAFRRLEKTTQDLVRDGHIGDYDLIFREWEQNRIIEKVESSKPVVSVKHYLGHRAVYKPGSTTPVRPVFNASGKTKNSVSLNDCLEKGPNLLDLIPAILSRFRMGAVGVVADVKKAFLQLVVTEKHRDCLRFLWWEDVQQRKKIVEYRHCRVVFGVSASPFLLGAVIQDLLQENEIKYPETVSTLRSSFYVDNCCASLPSLAEVIQFKQESQEIFSSAQMDLRGWEYGPSSEGKIVPVLGLLWDTGSDYLQLDMKKIISECESLKPTPRSVLKLANSVFDPLGLVSPFVILIKILFKRICADERKFSWDDELPEVYAKEMTEWIGQLAEISEVKIPRIVPDISTPRGNWTMHVFSDASKDAYACCIYLRTDGSSVRVQLIQARCRVTPKKTLTIPRAELLSCLIAARLYSQVAADLDLEGVPVTFWSDSTTALSWIRREDTVWGVFVNRRVEEIRKLTNIADWKHVPGTMNIADMPSRGINATKFLKVAWWEGPPWLYDQPSTFPNFSPEVNEIAVAQEKKKTVVSALNTNLDHPFMNLDRLGSWKKIVTTVAYVLRFLKRKNEQKGNPSQDELQEAERKLIIAIQKMSLPKDHGFRVEVHEQIVRVVTRLLEGSYPANFRYPILLPGDNPIVKLLIRKIHEDNSHAGTSTLKSVLRRDYWILRARRSVKAVIRSCVVCRVHNARRCKIVTAPLPADRIETTSCFGVVGIDLAGPLILKDGSKVWVVLFTCAVYRAVHLEVVPSLSTEAFIGALRKFVARRGRPSVIYSDNGTNFRGSSNLFRRINWKEVLEYANVKSIRWNFNAPTAAWWGGFWERLVGLTKQLLRRVLGKRSVYFSELELLVIEVEAVLNERPLTYLSEDHQDLQPLTPSLFLRDLPVTWIPEADVTANRLRDNHRHVQSLREQLRSRLRKEYLAELVHREKVKRSDILKAGDVVLVEVEGKKRLDWPMGVIVELYQGRDGVYRTARVRTTAGEMNRPLQRLFPLEVRDSSSLGIQQKDLPKEKVMKEESIATDEDLSDAENATGVVGADAEPVVVTRYGRVVKKPKF